VSDRICTFGNLTSAQKPLAGGKGGTLAQLYQAGYPVPEGFVVLPAAFSGDHLMPEAWAEAKTHLRRLRENGNGSAFAIRSSALSEDSALASFAGEFETVLDVHTDEMVRQAIHTVRRSRHAERVRVYSQAQGIEAVHDMAVVVQQLVRADISGVLFTADPVTGSHMQMTGNYVYGFGEELVSGEAEPYTFILERPKGKYDGPPALRRFARKLYKLASRLQRDLACPQDIEWAIAGRRLYVLQSRPITTLIGHNPATGEQNDSQVGGFLWSNTNLGEAFIDPLTAFTYSVAKLGAMELIPGQLLSGNICGPLFQHQYGRLHVQRARSKVSFTQKDRDLPRPLTRWPRDPHDPLLSRLHPEDRDAQGLQDRDETVQMPERTPPMAGLQPRTLRRDGTEDPGSPDQGGAGGLVV
jgi:hypothetical protein